MALAIPRRSFLAGDGSAIFRRWSRKIFGKKSFKLKIDMQNISDEENFEFIGSHE